MLSEMKVFGLTGSRQYAERLAAAMGIALAAHKEVSFPDGEAFCCPDENVRGRDVFLIQSLYSDGTESVNDKLVKLLIMIGASKDASAGRITVVCPYLAYARQDRKNRSRAPISTKYIAALIKKAGANRFLSLEVHNSAAQQNAFHIPADFLESQPLFAKHIISNFSDRPISIVSPDPGGLARVTKLASRVRKGVPDVEVACVYKTHEDHFSAKGIVQDIRAEGVMGWIAGRHVLVYDDMISGGTTTAECVNVCMNAKAASVAAVYSTHGLFVGNANENLDLEAVERIVVTDTIPPFRLTNPKVIGKLEVLPTVNMIGAAIDSIHNNLSISKLFL